jgi:heme-degrading monooxygenase HmoA
MPMYTIVWEYLVPPEKQSAFEKVYSARGDWAKLFNQGAGYLGTELLHDVANPQRYLTIDGWKTRKLHEAFLSGWKEEYNRLDARCEELTHSESCLGRFEAQSM